VKISDVVASAPSRCLLLKTSSGANISKNTGYSTYHRRSGHMLFYEEKSRNQTV